MRHYFINDPLAPVNQKEITFWFLGVSGSLTSADGVFSKDGIDYGSRVLAETVVALPDLSGSLLDLGCGLGVIGLLAKKYHPGLDVTLSDVNERAVGLARVNSAAWEQDNRTVVSDGFSEIHELFDCIVTNPPIRTGKSVIYPLFDDALEHLKPQGRLYIVMRRSQGAESAVDHLRGLCDVAVVRKERGYWVMQCRRR